MSTPHLTILRNLQNDTLIRSFFQWKISNLEGDYYDFLGKLYENDAQDDFSKYLADKIIYDENVFSVTCAQKLPLSPYLASALKRDISTLYSLLLSTNAKDHFNIGVELQKWQSIDVVKTLQEKYEKYGYGNFIRYRAFRFENGQLIPIESPSTITLQDLKDYAEEKRLIARNIEHFLECLPHSNTLLYGERGTGKSSTVHAMLNAYYERGLRLVELSKENMLCLAKLKEQLKKLPLKFMIYIDDLSLNAGDERISSLKAVLEGCSQGNVDNAMVVATSNRRHLIDEKFSERNDSVHANDSMQEELSLSDRFGLSILFSSTDKKSYLSIVHQLAKDKNLSVPEPQLDLLAERWAIVKGGRSPRRAKQFIDLAYALTSKGLPVEF